MVSGEHFPIFLEIDQPAPDHQHLAEVLGQALIDPEQLGLLRRVEVGRAHAGGPAELAAPGVDIFMRQQIGDPSLAPVINFQVVFTDAVQAGA